MKKTIAISLTVSILVMTLGAYAFWNYMPLFPIVKLFGGELLGTTLTDISSSDKMKDFPTVYNANLAAINAGKMEISTTTLPLITTLSGLTTAGSLATIGTIGTGAWAADVIPIAYGGTGSSTLTAYTVLLGNGTSAMDGVVSLGTTDQVLTSNGAGAKPTWQSTAVDETAAYTWTGNHIWNTGTTVFNGFSTMADVVFASTTAPTPTADQHVANKAYVDGTLIGIIASDTLRDSADTERSKTDDASWTKVKEFEVFADGEYRVVFDYKDVGANPSSYRVYRNGVAYGTNVSTTNTSYQTDTEDLIFGGGDSVELWYNTIGVSTDTAYVRNFRLYYDIGVRAIADVGTLITD